MKQLILNIEHWAEERNLIEGGKPKKQMLKLMEELGELCSGINKNKPDITKDSLGDCFVSLVVLTKQLKFSNMDFNYSDIVDEFNEGKYKDTSITEQLLETIYHLGEIAIPISHGWKFRKEWLELFFINLVIISLMNNFNFKDCTEHAYNQIKDRKGKMINGVFVKEADLNAPLV